MDFGDQNSLENSNKIKLLISIAKYSKLSQLLLLINWLLRETLSFKLLKYAEVIVLHQLNGKFSIQIDFITIRHVYNMLIKIEAFDSSFLEDFNMKKL